MTWHHSDHPQLSLLDVPISVILCWRGLETAHGADHSDSEMFAEMFDIVVYTCFLLVFAWIDQEAWFSLHDQNSVSISFSDEPVAPKHILCDRERTWRAAHGWPGPPVLLSHCPTPCLFNKVLTTTYWTVSVSCDFPRRDTRHRHQRNTPTPVYLRESKVTGVTFRSMGWRLFTEAWVTLRNTVTKKHTPMWVTEQHHQKCLHGWQASPQKSPLLQQLLDAYRGPQSGPGMSFRRTRLHQLPQP